MRGVHDASGGGVVMTVGSKVRVHGHGHMRDGVIDKLTAKSAWVRYTSGRGVTHCTRFRREDVRYTPPRGFAGEPPRESLRVTPEQAASLRAQSVRFNAALARIFGGPS